MKRVLLLLLGLSILGLGAAFAQDDVTPPEPNFDLVIQTYQNNPVPLELDFEPVDGGMNPPTDFTPTKPACSYSADSYLQGGIEAIRTNQVEIGDIVYGNADPEVIYTFLHIFLELELEPMVSSIFPEPKVGGDKNIIPHVEMGTVVDVLGEMTCYLESHFVGRFWKVEVDGISGYMLETLTVLEPMDLSFAWEDVQENSDPNNDLAAVDNPILVEDVNFRLLMPYVEVPPTSFPTTDELSAGDAAYPTPCQHGAPSHLAIGMKAEMAGPTYMKYPNGEGIAADGADNGFSGWYPDSWDVTGLELNLDDYGLQTYTNLNNSIPVREVPLMDGFFADLVVVDKATIYAPPVYGTQVVTIIGGPACDSISTKYTNPGGVVEYDPNVEADEQFYTLWQISLEVKGQTYVGWYPESAADYVWWKFEEGDSDRTHFLYFLQPIFEHQAASCDEMPFATLTSGTSVKPVFGTMNLRDNPNGNLAGEIAATDTLVLVGEPVCAGGAHWWMTDRGAWIAENNPETRAYVRLLEEVPVVIVEEAPPTDSTPEPSTGDPNPSDSLPAVVVEPVQPSTSGDPARGATDPTTGTSSTGTSPSGSAGGTSGQ